MKKVIICGHFAVGTKQFDGQTIKTYMIFDQLVMKYGKDAVGIIDTYGWKKHPLKLFKNCVKAARNASNIIIMPADKGTRVFVPLFANLKKKYNFKLHHILIGSELYLLTKKNLYLRNKLKKFDYVYAENHNLIKKLKAQGIKNTCYMPNFKKLNKLSKEKIFNKSGDIKCCIFSRIEKEKGIIDAIQVVNKYNVSNTNKIFLDIYGKIKENFEGEFSRLISGNKYIRYGGIINPDKSVQTIKEYDLLLFPTKYKTEGVPGTIIDAYYAGVPVLASRWENFNEIIIEGATGFGYKFDDLEDFYNKLVKIIKNRPKLQEISKNCLDEADKYSPEIAMEVLYNKITNSDQPKLLFYIDSMHRGGAERVMSVLVNKFAEQDYKIILVTDVLSRSKDDYKISNKVKRVYLKPRSKNFALKNWQRIKELRRIIKVEKIDTALSFLGEQNYRMLISTFGLKCRKCVSVRNDPNKEYGGSFIKKWVANRIIGLADICVFQTEDAKKYFCKKIQNKSEIIMNPVDDRFYKVSRAAKPKNIITVGRLEPQKNQKLLIDSFVSIANKIKDDKLLIYGDGSLKNELQRYINEIGMEDRILIKGKSNTVEKELANCKLFILPSDYEGMPNALMEAMAVGIPCIATDCPCGGPRSLIKNNKNGFLVSCGDKKRLSRAILSSINKTNLSEIGKNAKDDMMRYRVGKILPFWKNVLLKNNDFELRGK